MSKQVAIKSVNAQNQDALAIELGNLRDHFSPISFSSPSLPLASLPTGAEGIDLGDSLVDRRNPLPLDNAFVQQTKDHIRSIVASIAELAKSPIEPREFVISALPRITQAMGATGAALWQHITDSHWRLLGNHNLPSSLTGGVDGAEFEPPNSIADPAVSSFEQLDLLEAQLNVGDSKLDPIDPDSQLVSESPSTAHLSILNAVVRERQPILVPPHDVPLNRDRPVNPTSELLMYAPLPIPKEHGSFWLQVVQSPSGGPSSQRGYLRFVAQMADLMGDFFKSHQIRIFERDRECLTLAERMMNNLSVTMLPKIGLAHLMRVLRDYACSEHVFLLRRKRPSAKWRVVAAAGLVDIDRRATGIEQIEHASTCIHSLMPRGGLLGANDLNALSAETNPSLTNLTKTLSIAELTWIKPISLDLQAINSVKQDVALLITWSGQDKPPAHCQEQCALIARLGLTALQLPWWRATLYATKHHRLNRFAFANPATWSRRVLSLVGLLLLTFVLAIPVPIRLHATAVFVPLVQQHVYAPFDSIVDEVMVDHGQSVAMGQPLIKLRSPALLAEHDQTIAQQIRNAQRRNDIESRLLRETSLTAAQRDELEGERDTIESVQRVEQIMLERLQRQLDAMLVVAQFDGVVATWNVQETLRDRPLRTGQWLLSLHKADSKWILEATLPEQNAHEFRRAIQDQIEPPIVTMTGMPQQKIRIQFDPDSTPRIVQPTSTATSSDSNEAMLRFRFHVDSSTLSPQGVAAGATTRISIPNGRGPLAWALAKDFVLKVWTKLQMWI